MTEALAETYSEWVASLLPCDRKVLRALPEVIGLGGADTAWDDFVRLEPNRSLPIFVTDALPAPATTETIRRFVHAHRLAGFHGVVLDRIRDGQATASPAVCRAQRLLLAAWADALTVATGDRSSTRAVIAQALHAWRRGVALERRGLVTANLGPVYAHASRLKNGWVAVSAVTMLACHGCWAQAAALSRAYEYFLFALQCRDDVDDADEDRRTRGAAVPDALGVPAGVLVRAAPLLVVRAAQIARVGGLITLAGWLDRFVDRVALAPSLQAFPCEELLAMIVMARMDQVAAIPDER